MRRSPELPEPAGLRPLPLTRHPGRDDSLRRYKAKMSRKSLSFGFGAALVTFWLLVWWASSHPTLTETATPTATRYFQTSQPSLAELLATPRTARTGEIQINLGTRPYDFGSRNQARELLQLIHQHPTKASYTIAYTTHSDAVVLRGDLSFDTLVRIHSEPRRELTEVRNETWHGYAVDRLHAAVNGGSLSDTPRGKSFAAMETKYR
jgi:hypothetical protein